jgi:ABC-type proline/glycine betaine transport system substrate-binding protein
MVINLSMFASALLSGLYPPAQRVLPRAGLDAGPAGETISVDFLASVTVGHRVGGAGFDAQLTFLARFAVDARAEQAHLLHALEPGDALFDALDRDNDGLIELLGGEVGWAATEINDEKIDYYNENYDLDMRQLVVTHAGGHDELLATIKSKLDAQEDVLFYLWTPHHLFAEYADALYDKDGQILWLTDPWGFWDEPAGTDYHTGFPGATIYIAYRAGLEDEHPDVVKLLERISMTLADQNAYCYWESITKAGEATVKEKSEYARQWIEDHRAEVDSWLAAP